MISLSQLADRAEVGDRIRWVGDKSEVERPKPRTVTDVVRTEKASIVFAEGPQGGRAGFCVDEGNDSRAWYGREKQDTGEVDKAELVDKELLTAPWPAENDE